MATPEAEREARARGDVSRGRLAPMAGALVGGGIAVELVAGRAGGALTALSVDAFSLKGDPVALLRQVLPLLTTLVLPVMAAAFVGALSIGLLQTRGFFGRPWLAEPPERAVPNLALAALGWAALVLLLVDLLRASTGLATVADPAPLALAAAGVARGCARAFFAAVAAMAAIDHLIRARARRARLDETATPIARAPRPAQAEEPPIETLLAGVERVLYDDDLAVTFGRREQAIWAFARARGLAGRALVDAARRRGLTVRVATASTLEALVLGAPLAPTQLAELRFEVGS